MIFGERCFDGRPIVIPSGQQTLERRSPGEPKHAASLVKSRIFDPCNLTPIYQGHRADHHCLLRPSRDDDLLWMTTCASVIT